MAKSQDFESVLDTPQKKLAFFQNLVVLAAADNTLDEHESELLLSVGNRLGLSPEEVLPMVDNLAALSFVIPEEGVQKTLELQTLVQMMTQDGQVHEREYAMCLEFANRIGYGKDILEDMIRKFSVDGTAED
jgi:uncharacterized tellurite resistance protein B-like protein